MSTYCEFYEKFFKLYLISRKKSCIIYKVIVINQLMKGSKMKLTKLLAIILSFLMFAAILVSCDISNGAEETTTGTQNPSNENSNNSTAEDNRFDYFGAKLTDYIKVDESLYKNTTTKISSDYRVDDRLIDVYIDSLRYQKRSQLNDGAQVTNQAVKFGDSAFIYYKGMVDGVEFQGGSNWDNSSPYELGIGSSSFIPGFEDGLIGVIPENTSRETPFELKVTFPESYQSTDLAGKDAVFLIYMPYLVQYSLPEYNEDFIKNSLEFEVKGDDAVAEHRQYVKDLITPEAEYYAKQQVINNLWSALLEKAEVIKYPEGEVDHYYNSYIKQYETEMEYFTKYYGYTFKNLDEFVIKYLGLEEGADWKAETKITAELDTKQNMIFHLIAQKEGMVVTSADYQNTIQTYIDFYKQQYSQTYTASDIESMLGSRMIKEYAIFEKVNNFLFDNCTITYED